MTVAVAAFPRLLLLFFESIIIIFIFLSVAFCRISHRGMSHCDCTEKEQLLAEARDLVKRGKEATGDEAIRLFEEAGKKGDAVGFFNAGNSRMFGALGATQDRMDALRLWKLAAELTSSDMSWRERWADESNEHVACKDELDLDGL